MQDFGCLRCLLGHLVNDRLYYSVVFLYFEVKVALPFADLLYPS